MYYKNSQAEKIQEGLWWEETCVRRQGGYDLDTTNIPDGLRWFPKGAVLAFDAESGKAFLVKTAEANAAAEKDATTLKIVDNGLFKVGDTIAGSTISAIAVEDGIATLTVTALGKAVTKGSVVDNLDSDAVVLGLNYATVDLRDNEYPTVTPTIQAYEIEEDSLPYAVNDNIKEKLGVLHQFKIQ